jgi:Arc/MetJ family transcription regulator
MRTNIVIDDSLMNKAITSTGLKTKRAVVEAGLKMLVDVHGQRGIRRLRGKVDWEGDLGRSRRSRIRDI